MKTLSNEEIKRVLEAAIAIAQEPVNLERLAQLFDTEEGVTQPVLRLVLHEMLKEYQTRGMELREVASGYRLQAQADVAQRLGRWLAERPPRYSRALLETLALVAYRQPVTRAEIEEVRGVAVSAHIIRTLLEREWIKIVGHKDVPGRPALYSTTKQFLDYFNLKSLTELPLLIDNEDNEQAAEQLLLELQTEALPEIDTPPLRENE